MKKICFLLISLLFINSCTPALRSRYDTIDKQSSYVSVSFDIDGDALIGKGKSDVKGAIGEPTRILKKTNGEIIQEKWIYYPEQTNNFVAIIIIFENGYVKHTCYESVI